MSSITFGYLAGYSQGTNSLAIGNQAGQTNQSLNSIAVGFQAGNNTQGTTAVAIGYQAGNNTQGINSVALGYHAGMYSQGPNTIAVGVDTGYSIQGPNAIAVGNQAGMYNQGTGSIAIGYLAGPTGMSANSIALNASGNALHATGPTGGFYVAPIASVAQSNTGGNILVYANNQITNSNIYVDSNSNMIVKKTSYTNNSMVMASHTITFPNASPDSPVFLYLYSITAILITISDVKCMFNGIIFYSLGYNNTILSSSTVTGKLCSANVSTRTIVFNTPASATIYYYFI